jgi:hypothetical protein
MMAHGQFSFEFLNRRDVLVDDRPRAEIQIIW